LTRSLAGSIPFPHKMCFPKYGVGGRGGGGAGNGAVQVFSY